MDEAEFIASNFHSIYEALAPEFGYTTRRLSQVAWENVPAQNKKLMIATVQELLNHGLITKGANYELHYKTKAL
jgi:hypothetical protein